MRKKLIDICSVDASSKTSAASGTTLRIQRKCNGQDNDMVFRSWCGNYQMNLLLMQEVNELLADTFASIISKFLA